MRHIFQTVRSAVYAVLIWAIERVIGVRHTREPLGHVRHSVAENRAILVDVRELAEWDAGHLQGAILLPLSRIRAGITADDLTQLLPSGQPVYLHCGAGGRCLFAAGVLIKRGYDARPLKPGFDDLVRAGFTPAAAEDRHER